jgi:hypothetical protein
LHEILASLMIFPCICIFNFLLKVSKSVLVKIVERLADKASDLEALSRNKRIELIGSCMLRQSSLTRLCYHSTSPHASTPYPSTYPFAVSTKIFLLLITNSSELRLDLCEAEVTWNTYRSWCLRCAEIIHIESLGSNLNITCDNPESGV